ncbi:hypothetical protein Goshw_014295 [Gossypium schwendimanii]|uniref:Uncharacterized protein n=1 Tax=Gossypium schwendimanii TaxID=34291 RepID=A0A7J9L9T2_GOSSC|nr:hypothetical protein [Gossypium schwendimanii]
MEEYMALLRCSKIQVDKAYLRAVNVPTFLKKLMNITGMSEQCVTTRIKQKGDSKCIPWKNLKDLILAHPDTKKKVTPVLVILAKTFRSLNECRRAEIVAILRQDDISEEKWMEILQNLQEEDIE